MHTFIINKIKYFQPLLKGSIAVIDQGIVSGIRFLLILLLARYVSPVEYGSFVLAYGILMLANYFQMSFILTPMSVIGASLYGSDQKSYYGSLIKVQGILSMLMSMILISTSRIWSLFFKEQGLSNVISTMGFSIMGIQMQELFRRLFYNRLEIKKAVVNDIICYFGQIIGISFLFWHERVSAQSVFWVMLVFSSISATLAFLQCLPFFDLGSYKVREIIKKHWEYARWLLASMAAQWILGQIYIFISAIFLNVSSAGILGACRNLFGFINVVLTGVRNLVLSYGAKQYSQNGFPFLKQFVKRIYFIGGMLISIYVLLVTLFSGIILEFLYRGQYKGYEYVVILFSIHSLIGFFAFPSDTGLLILRKAEGIFKSYLFSSLLSLFLAFPAIKIFGLPGALIGMIIAQLLFVVVQSNYYKKQIANISLKAQQT